MFIYKKMAALVPGWVLQSVVLIGLAPAVWAMDCSVRYSYNTGSGSSQATHESVKSLSQAGQQAYINRDRINWVRNIGQNDVRLEIEKANGSRYFKTLAPQKRLPRIGRFLTRKRLRSVRCQASSTGPADAVSAFIAKARHARKGAVYLAGQLARRFHKSARDIGVLLKRAGFSINEVGKALKTGVNAQARETARILKRVFSASARQVGSALKRAGYSLSQTASALRAEFSLARDQLEPILVALGYASSQVRSELNELYGVVAAPVRGAAGAVSRGVERVGSRTRDAATQSAAALARQWRSVGRTASRVAKALKDRFHLGLEEVARLLRSAGYTAAQTAAALKSVMGATATQAARVLHLIYRGAAGATARALKDAGYALGQIAGALRDEFKLQRAGLERLLTQLQFGAAEIKAALDRVYGETQRTGRRAAGAVAGAVAQKMDLMMVTYGNSYDVGQVIRNRAPIPVGYRCGINVPLPHMGGRITPPVGLPNNGRQLWLTIVGKNLWTATGISGLPRGARARITHRARCGLYVSVTLPRSVREGQTGTANLMVGNRRGASFSYVVGPRVFQGGGSRVLTAPTSSSSLPDLEPLKVTAQLYRLAGGRSVGDRNGDLYTQLSNDSQSFCAGITAPRSPGNVVASAPVTRRVPNISWGVRNASSTAITQPFLVSLYKGGTVVSTQTIQGIAPGQVMRFTYVRPSSTVTVVRLNDGYCYHVGRRSDGWNDNPTYYVEVDSNNDIPERRENNRFDLGG